MRLVGIHACTFAVGDALVDVEGGRFAASRDLDRLFRGNRPRVVETKVARIHLQRILVWQSGAVVFGSKAGDVVRSLDCIFERLAGKIGSIGITAPDMATFAHVDRHADALVLVLLDGFDLAFAHSHRQAVSFANLYRGVRCALFLCETQYILGQLFQVVMAVGKHRFAHGLVFLSSI